MKAIKNAVELEGFRQSHIRDGVALVRYFAWLEDQLEHGTELTESQGADKLEQFRSWVPLVCVFCVSIEYLSLRELEFFRGLSFPTISSAGPNGGEFCRDLFDHTCLTMLSWSSYHSLSPRSC
jgi:Xaa-Pro aminopeptidase